MNATAETTIDEVIKACAADAVVAAARHNVELDYSEGSLVAVDELLGRESFIGPTPRTPESPEDEERLWSCCEMFGAYIGEVTIRVLGGSWIGAPTSDGSIRPAIEIAGVSGYPISKVWKRLTKSEFDTVNGYCRALRAIIEQGAKRPR